MADKTYGSVAGIVQDLGGGVRRDEYNGGIRTSALIRSFTTQQLFGVTVWPEFGEVDIKPGDVLFVDGEITENQVKDKTYMNISAWQLAVVPALEKAEREVVKKTATRGRKSAF